DAAQAEAPLGGATTVLEGVAGGEGGGEQFGRVAEGLVQPAAEQQRGVDEALVDILADGQANRRKAAGFVRRSNGHGPPPSSTGLRKGGSWPFSSVCPLGDCSSDHPSPQSGTDRDFTLAEQSEQAKDV